MLSTLPIMPARDLMGASRLRNKITSGVSPLYAKKITNIKDTKSSWIAPHWWKIAMILLPPGPLTSIPAMLSAPPSSLNRWIQLRATTTNMNTKAIILTKVKPLYFFAS